MEKEKKRNILNKMIRNKKLKSESKPASASFSPVSISGILGTNTPGVSKTYMLG